MKIRAYLQVSKNGKIAIAKTPRKQPLHNGNSGRWKEYYPTVQFLVNIEVPDECFKLAQYELNLSLTKPEVLAKIEEVVEEEKIPASNPDQLDEIFTGGKVDG